MNIHPILVHFPIALLTLYSFLELFRSKRLAENTSWFYIKFLLVTLGSISGILSLGTGDLAKGLLPGGEENPVVEAHEAIAGATILLFSGLAGCYVVAWLNRFAEKFLPIIGIFLERIWKIIVWVQKLFIDSWFTILLALLGLLLLTITGALGGYIVYGVNADIFSQVIARLITGQ